MGAAYRHKNSNQNLYSKEVFIKFKDRNLYKRVVMKVAANPNERKKQNPSIPVESKIKVPGDVTNAALTTTRARTLYS